MRCLVKAANFFLFHKGGHHRYNNENKRWGFSISPHCYVGEWSESEMERVSQDPIFSPGSGTNNGQ